MSRAKAVILDCAGPILAPEENALFRDLEPHGFILFRRHCENPDQVRRLVDDLRESVGRADAPILIDQEGGTIARLKEPAFQEFPGADSFHDKALQDLGLAEDYAYDNALEMASQLSGLGITVNCTPVLDIPVEGSHDFLAAHRVYGDNPQTVTALGRQVCKGHFAKGVTPVIKHIPGHGRAAVDSHYALPVVTDSYIDLAARDFQPFKALSEETWSQGLWAMTAHVLYKAIDSECPGSLSKKVIEDIIRKDIGFDGVLIADDISMRALNGDMADLAQSTIEAGCDLTLLCNQDFDTRKRVLEAVPQLSQDSSERLAKAEKMRLDALRNGGV